MHALFVMFVLLAVFVIGLVLFATWLIVSILRGLVRLVLGPGLKPPRLPPMPNPSQTRQCQRPGCRAESAVTARFCRRCGGQFEQPQRVAVHRAEEEWDCAFEG